MFYFSNPCYNTGLNNSTKNQGAGKNQVAPIKIQVAPVYQAE